MVTVILSGILFVTVTKEIDFRARQPSTSQHELFFARSPLKGVKVIRA
jgi:hypothetical protein